MFLSAVKVVYILYSRGVKLKARGPNPARDFILCGPTRACKEYNMLIIRLHATLQNHVAHKRLVPQCISNMAFSQNLTFFVKICRFS